MQTKTFIYQVLKIQEDSHGYVGKDGEVYSQCYDFTKTTTQAGSWWSWRESPGKSGQGRAFQAARTACAKQEWESTWQLIRESAERISLGSQASAVQRPSAEASLACSWGSLLLLLALGSCQHLQTSAQVSEHQTPLLSAHNLRTIKTPGQDSCHPLDCIFTFLKDYWS